MKKRKFRQLTAVMGEGVLSPGAPVVGADDLGLTRGDGCFDATRVRTHDDGVSDVDNLEAHLARLNRSIVGLGAQPDDLDAWRELVDEAVDSWASPGEATLKVMWTRGLESVPSDPVRMLTITPMTEAALAQRDGVKVTTLTRGMPSDAFADAPWLLGGVKSLSYAVNKAALREAKARGVDDVLFTSTDGYCLEGPTSALLVLRDGVLYTTPRGATGVLDSITADIIFGRARDNGWQCEDKLMTLKWVSKADSAWLVSSVRGAAPILELDGKQLGLVNQVHKKIVRWAGF